MATTIADIKTVKRLRRLMAVSQAAIVSLHQQLLLMLLPLMMLWSSADWQTTCEYVVVSWFIVVSNMLSVIKIHICSAAV